MTTFPGARPDFGGHRERLTEVMTRVATADDGARFTVVAPPGSGKAMAVAEAVSRVLKEKPDSRVLVIVPAPALARQWIDILGDSGALGFLHLDASLYRRLQAGSESEDNPLLQSRRLVVCRSFLQRDETRVATLLEVPWDVLVLDEVVTASRRSQVGQALRRLWLAESVRVAVSLASSTLEEHHLVGEELRIPHSHVGQVKCITYAPSERESAVVSYLEAWRQEAPESGHVLLQALERLSQSSMFALRQAVERRLVSGKNPILRSLDSALSDAEDEGGLPRASSPVARLSRLLELLDTSATDTKWQRLTEFISAVAVGESEPAVVLTGYATTARYLESRLISDGVLAQALTGSSTLEEITGARRSQAQPRILLVTDAVAQRPLSGKAQLVIHYDFPGDWRRFAARVGAFASGVPTASQVAHYFLVVDDERRRFEALLDRYTMIVTGQATPPAANSSAAAAEADT